MRLSLAFFVLLALATPVSAEPFVPEPLRPWVPWVLAAHPESVCPLVGEERICLWPGRVRLDLTEQGGSFSLTFFADRPLDLPLPGGPTAWPRALTVDGRPALLRFSDERPAVAVPAGNHRLDGRFEWPRLPESLAVPIELALVDLRVLGRDVTFPEREADGQLWLAARGGQEVDELDRVDLEVFRKIEDGVPVLLHTRMVLRVSGRPRELDLGQILPSGFEPSALAGGLPLRLTRDGRLVTQLRPGDWQIDLEARSRAPLDELRFEARPAPWPAEEIWVFRADPAVRAVQVEGAPGIEPARTSLPDEWKALPAFQLGPETSLRFTELRRGDSQPPPDLVRLARQFWLAQDGTRLTARDQLDVTLPRGGRLEATGGELGHAALAIGGVPTEQVITLGPESQRPGLEVRHGLLQVVAELTYRDPEHLPAVGWDRDVEALSATLHLPHGWTLLFVRGVDRADGTWIDSWTLLDFFLVLLLAFAVGNLYGRNWGLFALLALVLAWHERHIGWLTLMLALLLICEALRRKKAWDEQVWWRNVRLGLFGAAALALLFFVQAQWRSSFFPHLDDEHSASWGPAKQLMEPEPFQSLSRESNQMTDNFAATPPVQAKSDSYYPAKKRARQVDPNQIVQTGPGLPSWSGRTSNLSWRGPVDSEATLRFFFLSPGIERLLALARILFLALLLAKFWGLKMPPRANLATVGLLIAGLLSFGSTGLEAQEPPAGPGAELLAELERRLLAPPDCHPHCFDVARLELDAQASTLTIEAEVHAAAPGAWALPGPASAFTPEEVTVDGAQAAALRRATDGFLYLRLGPGRHVVRLTGSARDSLSLQFVLPPRTFAWRGTGWRLEGWRDDQAPPGAVRLDRILASAGEISAEQTVELPAWLELERELDIGMPWLTHSVLRRRGVATGAVTARIPLLPGESILTAGIPVEGGAAVVDLLPGETERSWDATLEERDTLELRASGDGRIVETWLLTCSPIWHCTSAGLAPTRHLEDGVWRPRWQPWPGETVAMSFERPIGAAGQTTTFDRVDLFFEPGRRLIQGRLEIDLRTSRGGAQTIRLPADASLETFLIDEVSLPVQIENGQLSFAVEPGRRSVKAAWRQNHQTSFFEKMPAVSLPGEAVNTRVNVQVPDNRWLLLTGGPGWGPVVMFWKQLLIVALAAFLLGRLGGTPLGTREYFLLGLGLTQIHWLAALTIPLWLIWLGRRRVSTWRKWWTYDLAQLVLVFWSLIVLICLYAAVHSGLLLQPDMQVEGPGSYGSALSTYVERVDGELPRPWVLWLPLWVYRAVMLGWALWLAAQLLRWLPWCWQRLNQGPLLVTAAGFATWRERGSEVSAPE